MENSSTTCFCSTSVKLLAQYTVFLINLKYLRILDMVPYIPRWPWTLNPSYFPSRVHHQAHYIQCWGIKPRAPHMLGQHTTFWATLQSQSLIFNRGRNIKDIMTFYFTLTLLLNNCPRSFPITNMAIMKNLTHTYLWSVHMLRSELLGNNKYARQTLWSHPLKRFYTKLRSHQPKRLYSFAERLKETSSGKKKKPRHSIIPE